MSMRARARVEAALHARRGGLTGGHDGVGVEAFGEGDGGRREQVLVGERSPAPAD